VDRHKPNKVSCPQPRNLESDHSFNISSQRDTGHALGNLAVETSTGQVKGDAVRGVERVVLLRAGWIIETKGVSCGHIR